MLRPKSKLILACLVAVSSAFGGLVAGCNSNSNEAEFLRTTSPGTPAEPESVASRRERTKNVPKAPVKSSSARRGRGGV
jgi:hypothetical protein